MVFSPMITVIPIVGALVCVVTAYSIKDRRRARKVAYAGLFFMTMIYGALFFHRPIPSKAIGVTGSGEILPGGSWIVFDRLDYVFRKGSIDVASGALRVDGEFNVDDSELEKLVGRRATFGPYGATKAFVEEELRKILSEHASGSQDEVKSALDARAKVLRDAFGIVLDLHVWKAF